MGRMSFLTISTRSSTTVKQLIEKPLQTSAWNVAIQPAVGSFYPALPPVPFASAGHRIKLEISISCVAIDNLLPRTTFCPLSVIFIPSSITAFSGLLSLSLFHSTAADPFLFCVCCLFICFSCACYLCIVCCM